MPAQIQAIASSDFTWTEELRHITNVSLLLIQVTVSILPGFPEQLASSQVINGTEDWKQQRITQLIIEWKPQVYKLSSTIMVTIHCECKLMFSKKIQGEVSAQADGSSSITCHQRQNMLGYTQKTCSWVYQSLLNSRLQSLSRFHTASATEGRSFVLSRHKKTQASLVLTSHQINQNSRNLPLIRNFALIICSELLYTFSYQNF